MPSAKHLFEVSLARSAEPTYAGDSERGGSGGTQYPLNSAPQRALLRERQVDQGIAMFTIACSPLAKLASTVTC